MTDKAAEVVAALLVARSWQFLPAKTVNRAIVILADEVDRLHTRDDLAIMRAMDARCDLVIFDEPHEN